MTERPRQAARWIKGIWGRLHRGVDFQTECWQINKSWQVLGVLDRKLKERQGNMGHSGPVSGFHWSLGFNRSRSSQGFSGRVLRRKSWRGEKGKRKFYFGCGEFDVPVEHSRGCVGLELKDNNGKYGFKNIRLKVLNKPRACWTHAESVQTEMKIN